MKRTLNLLIPFALLLISTGMLKGQDKVMAIAEFMPSLDGCQTIDDRTQRGNCTRDKIQAHLNEYLKVPKEMIDAGVQSAAVVEVIVDAEGKVTDMTIVDDPGYGAGDAAVKALKKLNKSWHPAEHFGEKVAARYKVPVQFVIPEAPKEDMSAEKTFAPAPGEVFTVVETMPAYAGCSGDNSKNCTFQAMTKYFGENLTYPEQAEADGIEGTVMTRFVIDEEGNVGSAEIVEGIGHGCDEEALRLINSMPAWSAGKHLGVPVKVRMDVPVHFKLRKAD